MNLINAFSGVLFAGIDGHVGATLVVALAAKDVHKGRPYGWCRVLKEIR